MKALVWHGDQDLRSESVEDPNPAPGATTVSVLAAGICGSDLHGYRGHPGPRVPPLILGHEAVVRRSGAETRFVVFPLAVCGRCPACERGEEQFCEHRGLLGLDRPGVFAEAVSVPADSLIEIPASLPTDRAVLTEPLAVAVSAVRLDRVAAEERVLVLGAGPIGLLYAVAARGAGAQATLVDPLRNRRGQAESLGFETFEDAADLAGCSFDVACDSVGNPATWSAAIRSVRRGGRVGIVGLGAASGEVAVGELVREGVTVRGHYAYSRADFAAAARLVGSIDLPDAWATDYPLGEGASAFADLVGEPDRVTKAILWTSAAPER
ncbi:MAG: zinc-dependent alcohol dehydrogenase [Solirubrobacterales bacterium]